MNLRPSTCCACLLLVAAARPDGSYTVNEKTPAVAVGLASPSSEDYYDVRLAPMFAVDDIPEVWQGVWQAG